MPAHRARGNLKSVLEQTVLAPFAIGHDPQAHELDEVTVKFAVSGISEFASGKNNLKVTIGILDGVLYSVQCVVWISFEYSPRGAKSLDSRYTANIWSIVVCTFGCAVIFLSAIVFNTVNIQLKFRLFTPRISGTIIQ